MTLRALIAVGAILCLDARLARARDPKANGRRVVSSDFDRASASFRAHAAGKLHLTPAKVHVGPLDTQVADVDEIPSWVGGHTKVKLKIGQAWGFFANDTTDWSREVRGWATAEGDIIEYPNGLGALFEEAKAWSRAPTRSADELATLIVWSMGRDYSVRGGFGGRMLSPTLTMRPDGTGTLKFMLEYSESPHGMGGGPGCAVPGPPFVFECTVMLSRDHQAHLTRSKNLNGSSDIEIPGLPLMAPRGSQ